MMTGAAYAQALYELADAQEQVTAISRYLTENPDYQALLDCGALSVRETDGMITELFGQTLPSAVLQLMARRRHTYLWTEFAAEMERLADREHGIIPAEIRTAVPLSEELQEKIKTALSRRTGKQIKLKVILDPNVLGGISIQAEGLFWDGTLREQLRRLQTVLKK